MRLSTQIIKVVLTYAFDIVKTADFYYITAEDY
jgi:hypothetical protein